MMRNNTATSVMFPEQFSDFTIFYNVHVNMTDVDDDCMRISRSMTTLVDTSLHYMHKMRQSSPLRDVESLVTIRMPRLGETMVGRKVRTVFFVMVHLKFISVIGQMRTELVT